MIHANYEVIEWLREHCRHDRVLLNALNNHSSYPQAGYDRIYNRWFISATSHSGVVYTVAVLLDPVTGDPVRFYRSKDEDDQAATIQ